MGGIRRARHEPPEVPKVGRRGAGGGVPSRGAGCGGDGEGGGGERLVFAFNNSGAEGLWELVRRFNEEQRGEIRVVWREMPAASTQYFEHMRAELQSCESNVDVIAGDVT